MLSPVTYTDGMVQPSRRTFVEKPVTVRMALSLWQRLRAASDVIGHSQAQIITDALEAYLAALPAKDRQLIESILARRGHKPDKS